MKIVTLFVITSCWLFAWFNPHRLQTEPPADVGSALADYSTLEMEAIRSSQTSVHTRSTWHHIPEEGILQINRSLHKNIKKDFSKYPNKSIH
jgi:hypothetical protein